jgi:hypothetical protein
MALQCAWIKVASGPGPTFGTFLQLFATFLNLFSVAAIIAI